MIETEGEATDRTQNDILEYIFSILDGQSNLMFQNDQNVYKPRHFDFLAQIDVEINQMTAELRQDQADKALYLKRISNLGDILANNQAILDDESSTSNRPVQHHPTPKPKMKMNSPTPFHENDPQSVNNSLVHSDVDFMPIKKSFIEFENDEQLQTQPQQSIPQSHPQEEEEKTEKNIIEMPN